MKYDLFDLTEGEVSLLTHLLKDRAANHPEELSVIEGIRAKIQSPCSDTWLDVIKDKFENGKEYKFRAFLKRAKEEVESWPAWKQNLLGTIFRENKVREKLHERD